jgi:hypothetical protein
LKKLAVLPALLVPQSVLAHPSHMAEVAGHSHYLALGAIGAAAVIGALAVLRVVVRRRSTNAQ